MRDVCRCGGLWCCARMALMPSGCAFCCTVLRFAVINNAWDMELTGRGCCSISAALRCLAFPLFKVSEILCSVFVNRCAWSGIKMFACKQMGMRTCNTMFWSTCYVPNFHFGQGTCEKSFGRLTACNMYISKICCCQLWFHGRLDEHVVLDACPIINLSMLHGMHEYV